MKNKIKYIALLLGVTATTGLTSCNDFLTLYPTDKVTEQKFWSDRSELESGLGACYYQMATGNIVQSIIKWGEYRATDNLTLNKMDQTAIIDLQNGLLRPKEGMFDWAPFYTEINYCNKVLENGQKMYDDQRDVSLTRSVWDAYRSEALTMRALTYFYLVRAFRNVPYVTKSIDTDREAVNSKIPQTDGVIILSDLIAQLEDATKRTMQKNFGNSVANHGRITEKAVYTLLADIRLWRGCMLKSAADKQASGYLTDSIYNGVNLVSKADSISTADFQAAADYCQKVIDLMNEDYDDLHRNFMTGESTRTKDFPLIYPQGDQASSGEPIGGSRTDMVYGDIFGSKNSSESIFELQYGGSGSSTQSNEALKLFVDATNVNNISTMKVSSSLYSSIGSAANWGTAGFTKLDLRGPETTNITDGVANTYVLTKSVATGITIEDYSDMQKGGTYSVSSNFSGPFIIYRLSDVMLIRAEALARLGGTANLRQSLNLVVELFKRNSPNISGDDQVKEQAWASNTYVKDLKDADVPNQATMLDYVYKERQREYVGEGKRWFDLVRKAESENTTNNALDLMNATKALRSNLTQMMSLYNPVYTEEIKANDKLVQNPVWEKNI